jgi:uncharacterized repeat protein (TIGR02543 family)
MKHPYWKRVSTFLIVITLVAAMVACNGGGDGGGNGGESYTLTMAVTPASGGTATDETNGSPYEAGTVVDIEATTAPGYQFVKWTSAAGTLADPNAATTTFTMPTLNATVTAHFVGPLDHFKCYGVAEEATAEKNVYLEDQFVAINATVGMAWYFCNPTEKLHNDVPTPISNPDHHLTLYTLEYEGEPQSWRVMVENQFQDDEELTVVGPVALAVPTQKEGHNPPVCLDHYLLYEAYGPSLSVSVELNDQFGDESVTVYEPALFANPARKTHDGEITEIQNPDEHLLFYYIEGEPFETQVQIDNQFGEQALNLTSPDILAVPSEKISWEQPLDHFKCYWSEWAEEPPPTDPWDVQLEDQFVTINATVTNPELFANPTNKWHGDVWTPISNPDNHLTFYWLEYGGTPPVWFVQVDNQFGINQELWVRGPLFLAVPTRKGLLDPPVSLDHFLVYEVIDHTWAPYEEVGLKDQFTDQEVTVYAPILFANPARKTHDGEITEIQNPDEHLLFYWIDGGDFFGEGLPVANQFGPQILNVYQNMPFDILGVPSQTIEWYLYE